jgi:DNA-directed RNA polymerase subunit RPC12/RpoP
MSFGWSRIVPKVDWCRIVPKEFTSSARYEYKCPYCGKLNIRLYKTARVVCGYCGRAFYGER